MTTLEVTQSKWERFCQQLEESCRGAMITIELVQLDGAMTTIARDLPLGSVILDEKSNSCITTIVIQAGVPGAKPVRHTVVEPIHVRLKNKTGGDRYNRVEILAENGTTIVSLHPGFEPGKVQGLG